jgi:hypothetical protein
MGSGHSGLLVMILTGIAAAAPGWQGENTTRKWPQRRDMLQKGNLNI